MSGKDMPAHNMLWIEKSSGKRGSFAVKGDNVCYNKE